MFSLPINLFPRSTVRGHMQRANEPRGINLLAMRNVCCRSVCRDVGLRRVWLKCDDPLCPRRRQHGLPQGFRVSGGDATEMTTKTAVATSTTATTTTTKVFRDPTFSYKTSCLSSFIRQFPPYKFYGFC